MFSRRVDEILHAIEILDRFRIPLTDPKDVDAVRLISQPPSIAVIGLVSRGKSTLVNRLIGIDLLPTGPNPVTFGCGYISAGEPRAVGFGRRGVEKELPTDPHEFRHRARRHDAQDIVDFEYTGYVRLPDGVRLIDTKGLDEVRDDYDEDIVELERAWAEKGAIGAVIVSSVPPGASAQDVKLFRSVRKHFRDKTFVVLKQIDSSISREDLEKAASVWRQHRAKVIVLDDSIPDPGSPWGAGPYVELESRLSGVWAEGQAAKEIALGRLEGRVNRLLRDIPGPRETTRPSLTRDVMWEVLDDGGLPETMRERFQKLLVTDFDEGNSIPVDEAQFVRALRLVSFGSTGASQAIHAAALAESRLRRTVSLSRLLFLCEEVSNSFDSSEIFVPQITDLQGLREVVMYMDGSRRRIPEESGLVSVVSEFIGQLETEESLVDVLVEISPIGPGLFAEQVAARLVDVWISDIESGRSLGPMPESMSTRVSGCVSACASNPRGDNGLSSRLNVMLGALRQLATNGVSREGTSSRERIRASIVAEIELIERIAEFVSRAELMSPCAEGEVRDSLQVVVRDHGSNGGGMSRASLLRTALDAEEKCVDNLETLMFRVLTIGVCVALIGVSGSVGIALVKNVLLATSVGAGLFVRGTLRRIRTEGLLTTKNLDEVLLHPNPVDRVNQSARRIRAALPGYLVVSAMLGVFLTFR